MSPNEMKALKALAEAYSECEDFCFLSFKGIAARSKLDPKLVRRTVRSLARKGFAKYQSGLWNDDGEMAGAGYCCTKEGAALMSPAMRECPHAKTPRNLHEPCQICGALGPWFDSCTRSSEERQSATSQHSSNHREIENG